MKILLVNNHTEHLPALYASLADHEVEVQTYRPGMRFHDSDKELVILSGGGGEGFEIIDKINRYKLLYEDEMKFVRETTKPVLGICMGFEVIVKAFGGKVLYRPNITYGPMTSHMTRQGQKLFKPKVINQIEAHYWYVQDLPKDLEALALSESGVEMIKADDGKKKILASQFHPEEGGTLQLPELVASLT